MSAKLLLNPIDVGNRLHELFGVTKEELVQVVKQGASARAECTHHHPSSMPGVVCWGESTKALRDLLVRKGGWISDNVDNIASVVHRQRKIKVAVTNGTVGTGIEWGHPQPIREKGDGAQRAVWPNQQVLAPILDSGLNDVQEPRNGWYRFWYLCIYCDGDVIRAELLRPKFNDEGMFEDFYERIALISDRDEDGGFRLHRDIPEAPDGDSGFEIPVTRKQAAL